MYNSTQLFACVCVCVSYHRPDEALVFWWFACKAISNEAHFGHHSLPGFLLPLSGSDHLQNLRLTLSTHFGKRDLPLSLQTNNTNVVVNRPHAAKTKL